MAPRNKPCGVCGKTSRDFPSPRLYEEHVKKHLDQTYSCDKCDIKFETKISLYDHQRHVHIPGIKCDCGCGKTFSRKQNYTKIGKKTFKTLKKPGLTSTSSLTSIFQTSIYFSNNCHVIIEHIPQVIKRTGKSLYLSSEQVVEATHAKFAVFWERYKVNNLEKESHGTLSNNRC